MANYNTKEYVALLKKGEVAEKELEKILSNLGFSPVKNISYDDFGNITWQKINTKQGLKRNLDFDIFINDKGMLVFKAECKQISYFQYLAEELCVIIEKDKFNDYLSVQADIELDCYVFFFIGRIKNGVFSEEYILLWDSLYLMNNAIIGEGYAFPENANPQLFYYIPVKQLMGKSKINNLAKTYIR